MSDNTPTSLEPNVYAELDGALAELAVAQGKVDEAERQHNLDLQHPSLSGSISMLALADALEELDAAKDTVIALAGQILEEHKQAAKLATARERKELDWEAVSDRFVAQDPTDPGAYWEVMNGHPGFRLVRSKGLRCSPYGVFDSVAQAQAWARTRTFMDDE